MARNKLMGLLAAVCVAYLGAALIRSIMAFTFITVGLLVITLLTAAIEKHDSELDVDPYGPFLAAYGLSLLVGLGYTLLSGTLEVTADSFTYVLGMPVSTLLVFVFVWIIPTVGGSLYFAYRLFPKVNELSRLADIKSDAKRAQQSGQFDLAALDSERGDD